jgi:UDP-N-acetylglucosamine acyltransferase
MPNKIHKTAIIGEKVKLGDNIEIGPYSIIDGNIEIANNNIFKSHIVISGNTKIGENNVFYPFSNIGDKSQDLKISEEESFVEIGDNNIIREHVTIHAGTITGNKHLSFKNLTKISNNCLLMVGTHIAHDCFIGNNVILANNTTLAGHVTIDDSVTIGGLSAILQFIKIGKHSMIGGLSGVAQNILPYSTINGDRASVTGVNIIGLRRKEFSNSQIKDIQNCFDEIFDNSDDLNNKLTNISKTYKNKEHITPIIDFIKSLNNKAFCKPK